MERFGVHRSLTPPGVLPQAAEVLDVAAPLRPDEIAVDVEYLNIDSASWTQLRTKHGGDPEAMETAILDVVAARGKMHNPVTGSGGMLVGRVSELGSHRSEPAVGTRIASLVSLTMTPLTLDRITGLDPESEKVAVQGRAILFGSANFSVLPDDLSDHVVLGALDVCGAPAWAAMLVQEDMHVVVIGAGGKSGMLTCAQAVESAGANGRVLGLCWPEETVVATKDAGAEAVAVDCTDPMAVLDAVTRAFDGELADVVFVCANVPGCEGGAILVCGDGGRIVFFSMTTSFTAAALTAEGVGKSCELLIGNGFVPGHAELALDLLREHPPILARFAS